MKKIMNVTLCLLLMIGCSNKSKGYKEIDAMLKGKGYIISIQNSTITIMNEEVLPGYIIALVTKDGVKSVFYAEDTSGAMNEIGGEVYLYREIDKKINNKKYYQDYKRFLRTMNLTEKQFIAYLNWLGQEIAKEKDEALKKAKTKVTVCKSSIENKDSQYTIESKKEFIIKQQSIFFYDKTMDEQLINNYKEAALKAVGVKGISISFEEKDNIVIITIGVDYTLIEISKYNEIMAIRDREQDMKDGTSLNIIRLQDVLNLFEHTGIECN